MNKLIAIAATLILATSTAFAAPSEKDSAGGLKEALTQGAGSAVSLLGRKDGFQANPKVHIPLPDSARQAEKLLRLMGKGEELDALETAMNRAAEAAVPQAKTLLISAVKQMSFEDARQILTGGEGAATRYFRGKTEAKLTAQFLPIVRQTTGRLKLAGQYNDLAGKASAMGLLKPEDASVERYVTRKALDGLYLLIAEEEKKIRENPLAAVGKLARLVFGSL
jgi:hypothetical protein